MKKTLCILLSLLLVFSVLSLPVFAVGGGVGDIDRDGTVTAADARLILRAAVGLEHFDRDSVEFLAADTDKDGVLTASDARSSLRCAVDLEELPAVIPSPASTVNFGGNGAYAPQNDGDVYADAFSRFKALAERARAEKDLDKRYVLFAEAESYLLDSAALVPTTASGGSYAVSRIAPHTAPFVAWGSDDDRLGASVISKDLLTGEERADLLALWEKAVKGEGTYDPAAYLRSKGHALDTAYRSSFSVALQTLDWLGTSSSMNTSILVNLVDGLVQYDNLGQLRPALAESWEVSEDGLTYTFIIRRGAQWFTSEGKAYADVTAKDFAAGFRHMLDRGAGLQGLVSGVVKGVSEYLNDDGAWEDVGCEATDDYTLKITLEYPIPYFPTMLGYATFLPMSEKFLNGRAGDVGDPNDLTSMVYCGPFLPKIVNGERIELVKNPDYYNAGAITLQSLVWIYSDGSDLNATYENAMSGALSGINLNGKLLQKAKDDGSFDRYAYISDTSAVTYFGGVNLNRGSFETGTVVSPKTAAERIDTATAVNNKNFRKALAFAFDKRAWNAVSRGEELAISSLRNMLCPPDFVVLSGDVTDAYGVTFRAGTRYGELVQHYCERLGLEIDVSDGVNGWYRPEAAKQYLAAAKEELGDSVRWPVQIDVVVYTPYATSVSQGEAYKKTIEDTLGKENVVVNLVTTDNDVDYYDSGFTAPTSKDANYDFFYGSGWGADYGDPSTFLDTFLPGDMGFMTRIMGLY